MKINNYLLIVALCCSKSNASAQTNHSGISSKEAWKIKPATIQTRWASQVSPSNVLPEYPRPQLVRSKWTNLNGLWEYAITDKNKRKEEQYDGQILVPFAIESSLSGVRKKLKQDQLLWYKRNITKPVLNTGERVLLHFGAVDFDATVFVNGTEAGNHRGGYQNFSLDITDLLKNGNNELVVKVWDPSDKGPNPHGKQVLNPMGIMYTPSSGIWQTVWMEVVPAVSVESIKLIPDIDKSSIKIAVNLSGEKSGITVKAIIKEGNKIVATKTFTGTTDMIIPAQKLWSAENPFLYDLQLQVLKNGKVLDNVSSYFGMRKIEIKKDKNGTERIFLNNKYTFNLGTLDQGYWPDGLYTAPTDEALAFDIKAIKAMGFNTIRKHIKIEPARWYYHADKTGMLVWQDMVNPGNTTPTGKQQFEKECKENIAQLFNHPSIITWVLFNEGWGAYDQARLTQWIKNEDPTRLVNGHSGAAIVRGKVDDPNRITSKSVNSDMTDVHSYPPPAIPPHMEGKAMVLGEFGGIGVTVRGHLWNDLVAGWGYEGVVNPSKMKKQYAQMVDTLIAMEAAGLSASIYTQPFDVEAEQNGIISYDRKVIKMPLEEIRKIHSKLWPATSSHPLTAAQLKFENAGENANDLDEQIAAYKKGKRDSAFLRVLAVLANGQQESKYRELAQQVKADYLNQIKTPFSEDNLRFRLLFPVNATTDPEFTFLFKNRKEISSILGDNSVDGRLKGAIFNSEIKQYVPTPESKPDWEQIKQTVISKYGEPGEEMYIDAHAIHMANQGDMNTYVTLLLPKWEKHPEDHTPDAINQFAWVVFEKISDKNILNKVIGWMGKEMESETNTAFIDTYANLLYKAGRKEDAIQWYSRIIEIEPDDKGWQETFAKMKSDKPTWPENTQK